MIGEVKNYLLGLITVNEKQVAEVKNYEVEGATVVGKMANMLD